MGSRKALAGLLAPPLLWLVVAYLGALVAIFATAFFTTDPFTNEVVRDVHHRELRRRSSTPTYLRIIGRTLLIAVAGHRAVHRRSRCRSRSSWRGWRRARLRGLLVAAVLVPLWASYLVKAYAWRTMVQPGGVLDSAFGTTPGYGLGRGRAHPDLPVAALHDPAGVCRVRAAPRVAPRGVGGPRRHGG